MTCSVHFLIVYNKLSKTSYISSQQANSIIPYASDNAKMHPDLGGHAMAQLALWLIRLLVDSCVRLAICKSVTPL